MSESVRKCAPCTVCCEGWLQTHVNGERLEPYKPCKHCTVAGCEIYETRPDEPCASFKCAWLTNPELFPEDMIPIKSRAIVMIDRKLHDRRVIFAYPVGETIPQDTLEWLMAYSRTHQIPLIYHENVKVNGSVETRRLGYGPPAFIQAVKTEITPDDVFRP